MTDTTPAPARRAWLRQTVIALLLLAVAAVALAARWRWAASPDGPALRPYPDAVEFAASAQALAQSGRFFLQVGPVRAPPHYSPGWPLALAAALSLGLPPTSLWRLAGLGGSGMSMLLAAAVLALAGAWPRSGAPLISRRRWLAALAAAAVAGTSWALAPGAITAGRVLLSDEPAALFAVAALGLALTGLSRPDSRRLRTLALASGLATGLAAMTRPVEGVLLAPPLLVAAALAWRAAAAGRRRRLLRSAAWWLAGAGACALVVAMVLARSERRPWQWSAYEYWAPPQGRFFDSSFAVRGNPRVAADGRSRPHLQTAAAALLGLVPEAGPAGLAALAPTAGWICLLALWRRTARSARAGAAPPAPPQGDTTGPLMAIAGPALAAWVLPRVLLFSTYYYSAERFYLPALALPALALAVACGRAGGGERAGVRALGWAGLGAWMVLALASFGAFRTEAAAFAREPAAALPRSVARWLAKSDAERAGGAVPFDPLRAQALGLLAPEVVAPIVEWGELPNTLHVRRLRRKGLLPPPRTASPPLPE